MTEGIIIQIIIGVVTLVGVIISNYTSSRRQSIEFEFRIGELEKKVDKHNSVIERVFVLEQKVEDMGR